MRMLPRFIDRRLANFIPPRLSGPVDFLNVMADELGVERVPSVAAMLCGDLTLVTDVPEILGITKDELESWRPTTNHYRPATRLRYVGPLFARFDQEIPEQVKAFLNGPGPIVYVAPTSVKSCFLVDIVLAVKAAGVRVLVGATIHDISHLSDESTCIAGILPNHLVMPEVDLAVIMGGQGSVQCAMASGTPIIGFPYHAEQELNLVLAERQGMAIRIAPRMAGTTKLTRAVKQMVDNPEVKSNAKRVKSLYESIDGATNAAQAILNYIEG